LMYRNIKYILQKSTHKIKQPAFLKTQKEKHK
jgi:hypothetical protein